MRSFERFGRGRGPKQIRPDPWSRGILDFQPCLRQALYATGGASTIVCPPAASTHPGTTPLCAKGHVISVPECIRHFSDSILSLYNSRRAPKSEESTLSRSGDHEAELLLSQLVSSRRDLKDVTLRFASYCRRDRKVRVSPVCDHVSQLLRLHPSQILDLYSP